MTTAQSVSPTVSTGEALTSLVVLTLLYGVLAVIEVKLLLHFIARGADEIADDDLPPDRPDHDPDRPLAFAY